MGAWEDGFAAGYREGIGHSHTSIGAARRAAPRKSLPGRKPSRSRKPTAYNRYMKKELRRLKRKHPRTNQTTLFKRAARSWKRKKGKK